MRAVGYSKRHVVPYTRKSRKSQKNYIKSVPPQKIVKFQMGDIAAFQADGFEFVIGVVSKDTVQIRDNALEAIRQDMNKIFEDQLPKAYYFAIKTFPHHILRENRMLTGAGADRMQTGMSMSFGTTTGRAALIKAGKRLLVIGVHTLKGVDVAKHALSVIRAKIPCRTKMEFMKMPR